MKKVVFATLILLLALVAAGPAFAQDSAGISLRLRKDFGFSAGNRMQGTFTATATGPEDLQRVVFLLDGQPLGEDSEAPFNIRFVTDSYATGAHTLSATGYAATGAELPSNDLQVQFVTPQEGFQAGAKIGGVILGLTLVIMLISFAGPMLMGRGKLVQLPAGAPRKYGMAGGTICPNCKRPYSLSALAPNLVAGKLSRCPYCGKITIARRYPAEMLRAAEAAEVEAAQSGEQAPVMSEEEKLRKELEGSRYQDM